VSFTTPGYAGAPSSIVMPTYASAPPYAAVPNYAVAPTYNGATTYAAVPVRTYTAPSTTYAAPAMSLATASVTYASASLHASSQFSKVACSHPGFGMVTSARSGQPVPSTTTISASDEAARAAATVTATPDDSSFVEQKLRQPDVLVLFSKTYCPFVIRAKALLNSLQPRPLMDIIELDLMGQPRHGPIQQVLRQKTGSSSVPQAFVNGTYVGGCQEMEALHAQGQLLPKLRSLGCQFA